MELCSRAQVESERSEFAICQSIQMQGNPGSSCTRTALQFFVFIDLMDWLYFVQSRGLLLRYVLAFEDGKVKVINLIKERRRWLRRI